MADEIATSPTPYWDQYLHTLAYSKLKGMGQTKLDALRIIAELDLCPASVREAIACLSPNNVDIYLHTHATKEMADKLGDDHAECQTSDIGEGFKAVLLYALIILLDSLEKGPQQ